MIIIGSKNTDYVFLKKEVFLGLLLSQLPIVSSMHLILAEDSRRNDRLGAQHRLYANLVALEQTSANCLQAKPSPSFAFANKVLLEHGHTPLFYLHIVHSYLHMPTELNSYKRDNLAL